EHSTLLVLMIDNFKSACGLGYSTGELLERSLLVAFCDTQLLESSRQLDIELILPAILCNTCFRSKVQEFRQEVMELITIPHVQLAELMLCSSNAVWIVIDGLQMVKHILRISIRVHGIISHTRGDV